MRCWISLLRRLWSSYLIVKAQKNTTKTLLNTDSGGSSYIYYYYLLENGYYLDSELPASARLADR